MSVSRVVHRFPSVTVALVGDLVADEYVYGETDRVSREAPVPVVRFESSEIKPGGAANAAANLAALGVRVRTVGVVGADAAGRGLVDALSRAGAEVDGTLVIRGRQTETKTRILAGGRSTTRQQMLRVDRSDPAPLSAAARRRLLAALDEACRGADALLVSDYGGGLFDMELIEKVRDIAQRMPVCVDSRHRIRAFTGVTLVKPNEPELIAAAGGVLGDDRAFERGCRKLLSELEVRALVVTRGRQGMWLLCPGERTVRIPAHGPAEAVDVTGAGDTVLASLTAALASGTSFEEAMRLSNVAASVVVQKPGTATCTAAELLAASGERKGRLHRSRSAARQRSARS